MENFNEAQMRECRNVEIKMPWGKISGKWWGAQTDRPILALHGWQDSAGTFDTLIPLLPSRIPILAIDLPGHGFSSHFPNGQGYHLLDFVSLICQIMEAYSWSKISILGHSMGSAIGFLFAGIFPHQVDFIIGLDSFKPPMILSNNYASVMHNWMKSFLTADERNQKGNEPPSYVYDECVEKLYRGGLKSIDREKCSFILNRNMKKSSKFPDRYYFHRDNRLKYLYMGVWPQNMFNQLLERIKCPILFIKASNSPIDGNIDDFNENISTLKRNTKFENCLVEGTHHVHLNEPHKISEIVDKFLDKYNISSKLHNSKL